MKAALLRFARESFEAREDKQLLAPISPSPLELIHRVVGSLELAEGDAVYDLGCGDGRWLRGFLEQHLGCIAKGVELNEELIAKARENLEEFGSRVQVVQADILEQDLSDAKVVVCYLFREALPRIQEKLRQECKPGTLVVSVGFHFRDWAVSQLIEVNRLKTYIHVL